jgi:hypothetical protein
LWKDHGCKYQEEVPCYWRPGFHRDDAVRGVLRALDNGHGLLVCSFMAVAISDMPDWKGLMSRIHILLDSYLD